MVQHEGGYMVRQNHAHSLTASVKKLQASGHVGKDRKRLRQLDPSRLVLRLGATPRATTPTRRPRHRSKCGEARRGEATAQGQANGAVVTRGRSNAGKR
jgi:hypothetical protein